MKEMDLFKTQRLKFISSALTLEKSLNKYLTDCSNY